MADVEAGLGRPASCPGCSAQPVEGGHAPAAHRRLRVLLRVAGAATGLTQREVAQQIGWSPSKLHRVAGGTVGVSLSDVRALGRVYGFGPEGLLELARLARCARRQPWRSFRDVQSDAQLRYVMHEAAANRVWVVESAGVIPALLRTAAYERALQEAAVAPSSSQQLSRRLVDELDLPCRRR